MTVQEKTKIKSVAIIGAGAAGLTSLFELLNTNEDGSTNLKYKSDGVFDAANTQRPKIVAFNKVVAFELNSDIGGIWKPAFEKPDLLDRATLDTERYNEPFVIRPRTEFPLQILDRKYSREDPLVTKKSDFPSPQTWSSSGVYRQLFSDVPRRYLRNSFIPLKDQASGTKSDIGQFLTNSEVTAQLKQFSANFNLAENVRFNTEVIRAKKLNNSRGWKLFIKETSRDTQSVRWYEEEFDGLIVSNGHYSIPYIPKIDGLSQWNAAFPGSIQHSKSFRDPKVFKSKRVVFVGTGLSGVDILQYVFPIAHEVIVSRTPNKEETFPWLTKAATSEGIIIKPRIKKVMPSNRTVVFEDGTAVSGVDYIILSTGYHWHYPFLDEEETGVRVAPAPNKSFPDGTSLVDGLYLNLVAVKDPSLAFVGVTVTPVLWPSFELEASAIAGLWSNNFRLLSKKEQRDASLERKAKTGANLLFHYYPGEVFQDYVDSLRPYLVKDRDWKNIFDNRHLDDLARSYVTAERLFYGLKHAHIAVKDTF
ncbi:LANO_0E17018g1_1 [Lachancea nothofagi CBS 11611]|uniref:LANO_0E17018g1_1 n=1 Tax=Lachancea nothofagi CBS 11611 TaxID=1266666 RepID=A0A1G4K2H9_9SACH|nr:LANO_0E17018g1_1 [Lachancea nothofagi CBS 11611]